MELRLVLRIRSLQMSAYHHNRELNKTAHASRFDAIRKARDWAASLKPRPTILNNPTTDPLPPRYSIDDILSIVNPDIRKAFDMSEVVLRLVDDSRLSVFKPKYGPNILTAWGHIMGKRPPSRDLW